MYLECSGTVCQKQQAQLCLCSITERNTFHTVFEYKLKRRLSAMMKHTHTDTHCVSVC